MKILVTGGAGYIGSHACKLLASKGFSPVVLDNLSKGNRWAVKWGPFEQGDIADASRVRAVLEQHRPVAMLHFAACSEVAESVKHPLLYYRNNVAGTAALLQTLIDYGPIPFFPRRARHMGCRILFPSPRITRNGQSIRTAFPSWSSSACSLISMQRMVCAQSFFAISMLQAPIPTEK